MGCRNADDRKEEVARGTAWYEHISMCSCDVVKELSLDVRFASAVRTTF